MKTKTASKKNASLSNNASVSTKGTTTMKTAASKKSAEPTTPETATVQDSPIGAMAFEATRAEREALSAAELTATNLDVGIASQVVLGALPRIEQYASAMRVIPGAIIALESLRNCAQASAHANGCWLHANNGSDRIQRLIAEALPHRARAFAVLDMGVVMGWFEASTVDALHAGTGYQDTVEDIHSAENLIRSKWPVLEGKVPMTLADLDAMQAIAARLDEALGLKEAGNDPAVTQTANDRQRAFTLLARHYNQVRRAMNWVRWDEGDADQIAPSLYLRSNTSKRSASDAGNATTTTAPASPPSPATPTTPAAPSAHATPASTTPAPAAAGPLGMPFVS